MSAPSGLAEAQLWQHTGSADHQADMIAVYFSVGSERQTLFGQYITDWYVRTVGIYTRSNAQRATVSVISRKIVLTATSLASLSSIHGYSRAVCAFLASQAISTAAK